jgi:hypothetical protein
MFAYKEELDGICHSEIKPIKGQTWREADKLDVSFYYFVNGKKRHFKGQIKEVSK